MNFSESETCRNLMRTFAGEAQAHTRYRLAARTAAAQQLPILREVFAYTAEQELTHAQLFAARLQAQGITQLTVDAGTYPLDPADDLPAILAAARLHELHEADAVYPAFAETAAAEGFSAEAALFRQIAEIEHSHAERFGTLADLAKQNRLFRDEGSTLWLCTHCGHLHTGSEPPQQCPVCGAVQGYARRAEQA